MFNGNGGYSLSDIAAVTEGTNGNGGFGNWGDGWWIILLFLFAGGWGGRGFGGFGGGTGGTGDLPVTRGELDFSNLDSSIRGVQQGLCDGFYAMNTGMLNGFTGTQNAIMTGFHGVDNAICTLGYQTQAGINGINVANMQNTNAITAQLSGGFGGLERQLADCCCENRAAIADLKYTMATNTCATNNTIANATRDIIDNQNATTRSILDFLVSDKLTTLQTENQNLKLKASQAEQNNYLIEALRPCPVPAYPVCAPYYANPCGGSGFGFGGNFAFGV
jgi:hypothetical protein